MILISSVPAELIIRDFKKWKRCDGCPIGCTTLDQLNEIKQTVKETGKIWSVNFSKDFMLHVAKAEELVNQGRIGK